MQRREFLAASAASALGLALGSSSNAEETPTNKLLIEVRRYHFASPEKQQGYEPFLGQIEIPAFNRAGIEPVGAFKLLAKDNPKLKMTSDETDLWVVLPHKSIESVLTLESKMAADEAYQSAGKAILDTPQKEPAFTRYESSLLSAFDQFPGIEVPNKSLDRVLQLRTYPSHSRERAQKKLEMFQKGGELTIFKRCGMPGVFFGEALIGSNLPSLTYMLSFENDAALKQGWGNFGKDPDWQKLKLDEQYKDTVVQPNIVNLLLRPIEGSQI